MIPGNLIHIALSSGASFVAYPDEFDVYTGYSVVIPTAQLFANDVDKNENIPFTLVSVQDAYGGTVSVDGANITFTSSGMIGEAAGFRYTVANSIGEEATSSVRINAVAVPDIVPVADSADVVQGSTALFSKSLLTSNDIDPAGFYPLTTTGVHSSYGGQVAIVGDNIEFTSTGITGEPAGFVYDVQNSAGKTAQGDVVINVTPLPDIEAYIYSASVDVDEKKNSYVPQSMATIFNTWPRINGASYYANKASASGNAAAWTFATNPDRFIMPLNVSPYNAILSPDALDNFAFDAVITSTGSDDDMIGLVAAFKRVDGVNHTLYLARTKGGVVPRNGWGIMRAQGSSYAASTYSNLSVGGVSGGFSSQTSRIKIERKGNIITAYCSSWNSNTLEIGSKTEIDVTSSSELAPFVGPCSYGYMTYSQANSTYLNASVTGGLDGNMIYDAETGTVWEYVDGVWTDTGQTIQQALGYPRTVTNPETGVTYKITATTVEEL